MNMNKLHLSLEVFPPKKQEDFPNAYAVLDSLSQLNPEFISVTYGAGGSNSKKTVEIASYIENTLHIPSVAHGNRSVASKSQDTRDVCFF